MRWSSIAANFVLALALLDARAQQAPPVTALPTGGRLAGGQATISQSGTTMSIVQGTLRAALDWQSFNIGANASVVFRQPSASSVVLNNVLGGSPSQIFGRLSSNGQVFLTNPSGILFGPGAQVDVGGILATTLAMSTGNFMSGNYVLRGSGASSSVLNQGTLRSAPNGYVALIAPLVQNEGTIDAARGTVALVAANAATVDFMADGLIQIKVDQGAINAELTNKGVIRADGGTVLLTASGLDGLARSVVNNSGIIEARAVENVKGVIRLSGGEVNLQPVSTISAEGGGQIEVQGGTVLADGRIDASNGNGIGGTIKLLGDKVELIGNARLDASGDTGGGTVLVGGDFHGANPNLQNAQSTYLGSGVTINVDATTRGDGGKVAVWADGDTRFYGTISARGGAQSGNGGFVETSAGRSLSVLGAVDTRTPLGSAGTWLLDPTDITIQAGAGSFTSLTQVGQFSNPSSGANTIASSVINSATSNVTLQASGSITFGAPVSMTTPGVGLTAQTQTGDITVNSGITTAASTASGLTTGSVTLSSSSGNIVLNSNIVTGNATVANAAGATTATSGGITLTAPGGSVTGSGLLTTGNASLTGASGSVRNSTDKATSGSISITAGTGGVNLVGANALTVGTSNVVASLGTATSGNISVASGGAIDAIGSPLEVKIGSATAGAGATSVSGMLSASTSASGAGIFAASPSASLVLSNINAAGIATITSGSSTFATGDLTTTGAINAGGTVVLQAARDVTIGTSASNTAVSIGTSGAGFVAQAGRHVTVNAPVTTNDGVIVLEADSPTATAGAADKIGQLTINAAVTSNGGAITLIGGGNSIQGPDGNVNAIADNGGIRLGAVVDAGGPPTNPGTTGGINVALSGPSAVGAPLGIGTLGISTQILGSPISNLHTTGALVIGTAMAAGTDGRGTGAVAITASAISDVITGAGIGLTPASGSSVALVAGAGGITVSNALTSQQPLTIQTTGNFTLSAPLSTNNSQLTLGVSGSIKTTGGSITTGTAPPTVCTAPSGCPTGSVAGSFIDQWNGSGTDWETGTNWSLGHAPGPTEVALIPVNATPFVVSLGSSGSPVTDASVGLLVNNGNLSLTGNAVTKTSLAISNTFFSCSSVICSGVTTGTTNTSLNFGTISLSNAILSGNGSLENRGTVNLVDSTISASVNQTAGILNATSGSNVLSGSALGIAAGSSFNVLAGTTTMSSASGSYAGTINIGVSPSLNAELDFTAGTHSLAGGTLQTRTAGSVVGIAGASVAVGSGATYSVGTTNVSAGALAFDSTVGVVSPLTLPILNLSGGSLQIAGKVAITDMTQTGGSVLPGGTPGSSGGSGSIKVSNFHTSGSGGTFAGTGGTFGTGDCVTQDCFSDINVTFGAGLGVASPLAASNSMTLNAGSGALTLGAGVTVRDLVGDPSGLLGKGTLTLTAGTSITQSAGVINAGTVTGSAGTTASLSSSLNTIADLGAFTTSGGPLSVKNSTELHVTGAVSGGTSVTLEVQGSQSDFILDVGGAVTSHAGDIVVSAGNTFVNNASAGVSALSANGGRWLVYSNDFLRDAGGNIVETRGGLAYDFKQYNIAFGGAAPVAQATGNGFLYAIAPVITPGLSGSASKVYNGLVVAPTSSLLVTAGATDAIDGDSLSLGASAATYDNRNAGTGKSVTVLATDINFSATSSTGKTVYGYRLSPSMPASLQVTTGTIGKANLTIGAVTDTKTYDGTITSTGTPTANLVTGTVGAGAADSLTATQVFDSRNAGARTLSVASGFVVNDGNGGNNYNTATLSTAAGTIGKANLSVAPISLTLSAGATIPTTDAFSVVGGSVGTGDKLAASLPVSTTATSTSPAGSYGLTPGGVQFLQGSGSDYNITYQMGTLTLLSTQPQLVVAAVTSAVSAATTTAASIISSTTATSATTISVTAAPSSVTSFSTSLEPSASTPVLATSTTSTTSLSTAIALLPPTSAGGASSSTTASSSGGTASTSTGSSSGQQSSGGQGSQQASTAQSGIQAGTASAAAAAASALLVSNMLELHTRKLKAVENAVKLLEQDPTIADLKPCSGSVADDCIAVRPAGSGSQGGPQRAEGPTYSAGVERKVALLIGIDDYQGGIPKLSSPVKDMQEIGKIMNDKFGYEVRTVLNVGKAGIVRELNRLILESNDNDSIAVMYAGHGQLVEKTQRGYWIPAKASADDPRQWISNQDIARALGNILAKQIFLVSDSCYSGTLVREAKIDRADIPSDPQAVLDRRSVTALSSGGEEPVADDGKAGHSVFAWHLMEQLRAVKDVSLGVGVYEKIAESVKAEIPQTPQYGASLSSGYQRGGDYLFEIRERR